ncbi:hypothetical protein QEL91_004130 [Pseudomonas putida]|nr:hypothetical protein [Pseudomonas putida]
MDLSSTVIFIAVMAVFFGWLSFSMPSQWKIWMGYFGMVFVLACAIYIATLIKVSATHEASEAAIAEQSAVENTTTVDQPK